MLAATIIHVEPNDPLAGVDVGEHPELTETDDWTTVEVPATPQRTRKQRNPWSEPTKAGASLNSKLRWRHQSKLHA